MPKLIAIEGPVRGAVYPLEKAEVSIGRSSSNDIAVADLSLSRRHSAISCLEGVYWVSDLESNNGTFVNGASATRCQLAHGDRIAIGDSVFLFLLRDDKDCIPRVDPQVSVGQTIQLSRDEAFYLHPEQFAHSGLPATRLVQDLQLLLQIGNLIATARSVQALARQLLELILEAVPAERGAILFVEEGESQISTVYGWDRRAGKQLHVPISSTIIDRVLKDGVAISSSDTRYTEAISGAESLRLRGVRALLAVPILRQDRVLGVIYLDSSDPSVAFDVGHLQLLTAVSGVASLALENLRHLEVLKEENRRLEAEVGLEHNMVGESAALRETIRLIGRVAPTDSTVIIFGESGSGKELAARAIHQNSPRAKGPFLALNCAVLTENLLESELFGHERGAFTGAIAQKKGKLELADGGTVFLDEIGELAVPLQAKLLRVLQEREFERVGGTRPIKVDVRLIAATHRDLAAAVKNNTFRQDLFYRLNVVSLTMPPLRERREDIALLANHFLQKFSRKVTGRRLRGFSSKARLLLENYDWPGNIRELENVVERAVVLGSTDLVVPEDLPETVIEAAPATVALDAYHAGINEARRQIILRALERSKGNITQAARVLGIQSTYLHRLIRNLDIKPGSKSGAGEVQ